MALDFSPQFHKRISRSNGQGVWVAAPHPGSLIPVKNAYYHAWQREERLRLQRAGENVIAGSAMDACPHQ